MQTAITFDLTGYAIEVCDIVKSIKSGFEAIVTAVSADGDNRPVYILTRLDTGGDAILFQNEITLVKKTVKSFTGFQVSEETAARTRNWREGELAKIGR